MRVKGAAVPYIVTPIDEYLVRLVAMKLEDLAGMQGASTPDGVSKKARIQQELLEHQPAIGQRDACVLVGEAYIDGSCTGKAQAALGLGGLRLYDT